MCAPAAVPYLPQIMAGMNMVQNYADIQARNTQAALDKKQAQEAAFFDRQALDAQSKQLKQAYGLEMFERKRQESRETGRLTTASGEAGVGGNTPLRELANAMMQSSYDTGIHQTSLENSLEQTARYKQQVDLEEQSRIQTADANSVNPFMAILQVGTGAMQGWYNGKQLQRSDPFYKNPVTQPPAPTAIDSNRIQGIYDRSFSPSSVGQSKVNLLNPVDFYGSVTKWRGGR